MPHIIDHKLLHKIALVVKELRLKEHLSQEDVYNDIDIHVGRIETGKSNMTISTLSAICKYFKISISDFFRKVDHL